MSHGHSGDIYVPFRAIFFDLGNTLIYFDHNWNEVFEQATLALGQNLNFLGVEVEPSILASEFGQRMNIYYEKREIDLIEHTTEFVLKDLLEAVGYPNAKDELVRSGLDAFYSSFQPHWQVEKDSISTLKSLKAMGYRVGLISNAGDARDIHMLVDRNGLRPYFDRIWISADVGVRKPHPRIFEIALDSMYVRPKEAVMVGDSLNADILGANNIGMASIWLTRRADPVENDKFRARVYPEEVITTLTELPSLLANW